VESELFGHVKGAFTGAHDRRVGRFELANGGTLFLDEVSELPPDTQAKLLRVLQEREFEPVGSSKTQKVNVRVIAASNRDLAADSRNGRFRADLYYRLNVFPIDLPSLRERRDDIPLLANYFLQRAARKLGKRIDRIETGSLARLVAHSWPGNIRDLQNVIERGAILADGPELVVNWDLGPSPNNVAAPAASGPPALPAAESVASSMPDSGSLELQALERRHIVEVLKKTRGVIEGPRGAAQLLKLKPSTTRFRIRKLGIQRAEYCPTS
jgi:formate hydrogenlyase transcriptional activator